MSGALTVTQNILSDCMYLLFDRDSVDKSDVSWTGPTRMSTESLPSKALSMTSSAVLSPVGDSEPLDRSISQPNIAGGLKLPATVPPSPTVLASCSSTSSDLSRGGYASADSLGSVSSKEDMLSAALTGEEMQSLSTERSTRSASPCPENVPNMSLTVEELSLRSSSLSASLEPTPDLVLNLPTSSESAAVTHTQCAPLTSAEMFASAEHGTIKKSGTPGRSSTSGEDGTGMDEVFPNTPLEITEALECDSFDCGLLPTPPPAVTDVAEFVMESTDEECKLPPDDLPDLSPGHETVSYQASSVVALSPCSSASDSCSTNTTVYVSQFELTSAQNTESAADVSAGSVTSEKSDDCSSELKSSDLVVGLPLEPPVSQACEAAKIESVGELRLSSHDASRLSEEVCSDSTNVMVSAAELQSHSVSSVVPVAQQPVNLHATLSDLHQQEITVAEQLSGVPQTVAAADVLPVDAAASCLSSAQEAATDSGSSDVLRFSLATSSVVSSDTHTDITVQSTTSTLPVDLRPASSASPRPSSSASCTAPSVAVLSQPEVVKSYHSAAERRSSESAITTSSICGLSSKMSPVLPQSAISHLVLATHKQATSVAATSFPEPLPHRPPPSLAAHSAALQLLSQKQEPSGVAVTGAVAPVEKPEASAKLEPSPTDRPKSKPPPVKKKPSGPLKEKFFAAFGDHHQQ